MRHRIVITGAPASGKTYFINRLKEEPFTRGFIFFDELARHLLESNPSYRQHWKQFHIDIYNNQVEREENAEQKSFFTDRGTIDAFAFLPETMNAVNTTLETEYQRYDAVILLESSANLGEDYYKKDSVRNESIDDAVAIEQNLREIWRCHPGFHFIKARRSIEEKYSEFIERIKSIIIDNKT